MLVLAAISGGLLSALGVFLVQGSALAAVLAYLIGGAVCVALMLAVIWVRARPVPCPHPPSFAVLPDQGCLVFGHEDADLADRVNVNRIPREQAGVCRCDAGSLARMPQTQRGQVCPTCRSVPPSP